jgi:hypothetical protein
MKQALRALLSGKSQERDGAAPKPGGGGAAADPAEHAAAEQAHDTARDGESG